jgi:NAD(P)H-nitrite reductase large subunit
MTADNHDTDAELDMVICDCSGTTKRKILQLIEEGSDTVDAVSRKTGAQSGCGGCEYDLELIFQQHRSNTEN